MKLYYKDTIGFSCLILITIAGGLFLFDSQLKIALISEYHDKMSEPTINVLQETLMSYEKMQKITNNIILFNQGYEEYEYEFEKLHYLTNHYDQLGNSVNSNQEFMASPEMRIMMVDLSNNMHNIIERTDEINQQIFVSLKEDNFNDIQIDNLFVELNNHDKAITSTIQTAITMELEGKTSQQQLIDRYVVDSTFAIFGMIVFMICVIVFITTFSRNPMLTNIKNIKNATRKISEGDFNTRVAVVGNKDEMFDLASDINLMAKKLLEQQQELIETERLSVVGELSAILAHDIRNPLNVIKQSTELIQLKTNQEKTQRDFQRIDESIKRIAHQVDQVLSFVKVTPLVPNNTTVLTTLKQSLDLLTIPDNISIEIPEEDFEVEWDEAQISVVFTNVILNAIQAIGKDDGNISIRILEENETVIIVMEDTGPDIPEKELEKIFQLLYTTKMEGTGLGLAGCKNIVQSHKGTITVSNNPVIFTITLPKIQKKSLQYNAMTVKQQFS